MKLQKSKRIKNTPASKLSLRSVLVALVIIGGVIGYAVMFSQTGSHTTPQSNTTITTPEQPTETPSSETTNAIDTDTLFNNYSSTYDDKTSEYNFSYNDLNAYFGSNSGSSLKYGTSTYSSGDETWTINCSQYSSSCTAYSSSGKSASSYCSKYTNSCSTYGSDGSSTNTYCSQYSSSCSSYSSDGSYSNTYCSKYSSSCSSYDSNGGYSNTYCSTYSNSCSTYNSDGSSTNTYCSSYSSSCNSYTSGGYNSSYDW